MISLPEFLFMAEAEGITEIVSTNTAKLNAVIRKINAWEGKIPQELIEKWAEQEGIYQLSKADWNYILNNI